VPPVSRPITPPTSNGYHQYRAPLCDHALAHDHKVVFTQRLHHSSQNLGIACSRLITAHPQKQCDTKPLIAFPHTTKTSLHSLLMSSIPKPKKALPTLEFLNKTNNAIFITSYCKLVLPCKRMSKSKFRGFQPLTHLKFVTDAAWNLLATTST